MENREQLLTEQFKSDKELYKKSFELAQRLSDAVWQGNYSAFMPSR